VLHGETTLSVWSYIVALISGAIVTPFSTLLFARVGNGIATNQLFKMIAGAINPGRPVANLYVGDLISSSHVLFFRQLHFSQFSMWSHDVVSTSIGLAGDLKMGQYLKVCYLLETLAEILIVPRKDSSACHVFISNLGNDYWYVPESTVMAFGSLMLSIARGDCELWCVPLGARPQL
jgi:hypothetical protein